MAAEQNCPDASSWRELLEGAVSDAEQAELAQHLEGCETCRKTFEELAGGADVLADAQGKADEAGETPATVLRELMEKLKADAPRKTTAFGESTVDDISLDFLDSSDSPEYLGRLGTYEVTEVVGQGGMGIVLKAHDPALNRFVAVKVMSPQLASSATARKRFLREAQAAAAVSHDHVVTIHAVNETHKLPFLVMEYIDGMSLEQRIDRSGPLGLEKILRIGMQTASGLAAAHAQGLVHRDIKPANILLENGVERVKITDFGLARAADDVQITQTGVVAGTPQYMSPEQTRGKTVDHRSDLFSLGCVLYAMCTGRSPFRASTIVDAIRRVCEDTPRPIREVNSEIPDWLAELIEHLLAKDPDDRLESASKAAELLGEYLAHVQQPQKAPLPSPRPRETRSGTSRSRRAWWKVAVAAGCLGLVLLVIGKFSGIIDMRPITTGVSTTHQPVKVENAFSFVDLGSQATFELTDDGGSSGTSQSPLPTGPQTFCDVPFSIQRRCIRLGGQKTSQATESVAGIPIGQEVGTLHFLHGTQHAEAGEEVLGFYTVHYEDGFSDMVPVIDGTDVTNQGNSATSDNVAWMGRTANGKSISLCCSSWANPRPDKRIASIDFAKMPQNDVSLFCAAVTYDAPKPRAKPAEALLILNGNKYNGANFEVTLTGNGERVTRIMETREDLLLPPGEYVVKCVYRARERLVRTGTIRLAAGVSQSINCGWYELGMGASPPERPCFAELLGHERAVEQIAFSHDGRIIAAACQDGAVHLWRGEGAQWDRVGILRGHKGAVQSIAFSPDDKLLATAGGGKRILLWDWALANVQGVLDGHEDNVHSVAFSPDCLSLASIDDSYNVRIWDLRTQTVANRFEAFERGGSFGTRNGRVIFSRDGAILAAAGPEGRVKLWDASTLRPLRELYGGSRFNSGLAFSPDGSTVVATDTGGTKLWDTATGELLETLPCNGAFTLAVAFSPDGKTIACGKSQCVRLFDVASRSMLDEFPTHWDKSQSMAFCPTNPGLLATAGADHAVRLWDVSETPAPVTKPRPRLVSAFLTWEQPFGIGPGRLAIAEGRDKEYLLIRNLGDLQLIGEGRISNVKRSWLRAVCCLPNGQSFVTVGMDGQIVLWALNETGKQLDRRATQKVDSVTSELAVSPDGRWIAATEQDWVRLYDADKLTLAGTLDISRANTLALAFCPQRPILAVGTDDGRVMLCDIETKEPVATFSHGVSKVLGLAFSPDGKTLASTTSEEFTVKLWNVEDLAAVKEIQTLEGHTGAVFSADFSPDGRWLVTGGGSYNFDNNSYWYPKDPGQVKIWDLANGRCVADVEAGPCAFDARFTPDGKCIVTAADNKLNIWDVQEVLELASSHGK